MTARGSNIAQHYRFRVKIVDDEIEPAIAIEISDCESSSGPRVGKRVPRRCTNALKLPLHVAKQQRLLRVTRSPLMRIDLRINMTIYHKKIQPAIVVEI